VVESVAWSVYAGLGLDTGPSAVPYVAGWTERADGDPIEAGTLQGSTRARPSRTSITSAHPLVATRLTSPPGCLYQFPGGANMWGVPAEPAKVRVVGAAEEMAASGPPPQPSLTPTLVCIGRTLPALGTA
jgi:hypothetical protein